MLNTKHKEATTSLPVSLTQESPSFVRCYHPDHNNSSTKLSIPTKFSDKYNIKVKVKLKNLSGKVWHVYVDLVDGVLHFTDGWSMFVRDNALQRGQFLIFYYERASSFYVEVYSEDGLMKEDAFVDQTSARASSSATTTMATTINLDASVDEVAYVDLVSDEDHGDNDGDGDGDDDNNDGDDDNNDGDDDNNDGGDDSSSNDDFELSFYRTIRTFRSYVTVPRKVLKKCVMKLPQDVTLLNEEGFKIVTKLRKRTDGIIFIGYAGIRDFWEASEVNIGDFVEFKLIHDDDANITEITMKKISSVQG